MKTLLGGGLLPAAVLGLGLTASGLGAAERYNLRSARPDGSPVRVSASLEVGGHLKVAGEKAQAVPMSVVAEFGYDEHRLDDGSKPEHRLALRYYDEVQATLKTGSEVTKPELRESRRLIAAATSDDDVHLLSPRGPLTRDELELIDIPANTLVLDELLPQDEIGLGHKWKPSDKTMARLLGLDAVGHTEVECQLVDVKEGVAEITLDGTLGGAIDGVASDIELKGKLLYDTGRNLTKSLLLAVKEQRGIGTVGPGLDIVAKIKVAVSPVFDSKLLAPETMQGAKLPESSEPPPLEYRSDARGFRFLYDRRWHITREEPDLVVMRYVDRGDLIAQCNVAPATQSIDKPVELTQFQADVQKGLGKLFGKFERAREGATQSGLRVLESVAVGAAQELPIQWRYYLVHDSQGRAVSAVFTMEGPLVKQFGDQDKLIIESVEFLEPKVAAVEGQTDGHTN